MAQNKGVKTAYASSFHYSPGALHAKQLVANGTIGKPTEVECMSHFNLEKDIPFQMLKVIPPKNVGTIWRVNFVKDIKGETVEPYQTFKEGSQYQPLSMSSEGMIIGRMLAI